ncbi:hypothetical protein [Arcticibacter sp. MXS-1]|uniref:hypothetical protein n=1 Tax=Arcticibacter sp. MXS-1 TaxID=3341726 RepID=UPI0035A88B7C
MKTFFLLLLVLAPFAGISQQADTGKIRTEPPSYRSTINNTTLYSYTIGFKLFSYEAFPKILDQVNADQLRRSSFNGVILKYNDNQISYRLSGNFYSQLISFRNRCSECEEVNGRLTDNQIKVGFEKNFIYSSVQPYAGLDIGIKSSVFKGGVSQQSNTIYDPRSSVRTEKNGISLSPVIGVKFNLINHLSLAAETTMDVLYSYERQERGNPTDPASTTLHKYYKWEYLLKPVGMLSVQYNFGAIY